MVFSTKQKCILKEAAGLATGLFRKIICRVLLKAPAKGGVDSVQVNTAFMTKRVHVADGCKAA